jgi:hypothetical protein
MIDEFVQPRSSYRTQRAALPAQPEGWGFRAEYLMNWRRAFYFAHARTRPLGMPGASPLAGPTRD